MESERKNLREQLEELENLDEIEELDDLEELVELVIRERRQERLEKRVLKTLLDKFLRRGRHLLALRAEMGSSTSFIASVSMRWIAKNVNFAKSLPIWEKDRAAIDQNTLDELQQRAPDWSSQIPMVYYLAKREHHKFPTLLVTGWQEWTADSDSDNWVDGRARRHSVTARPLDGYGRYIDLETSGTKFFALDGQHRLMAIKGLVALLNDGKIPVRNKEGKPNEKKNITLEQLGISSNDLESLLKEKIGIEIIPSVVKGENADAAKMRLRNIFVAINQTAKKLTRGELALLDENNGYSIVARRVMARDPLLKARRVLEQKGQLNESAFHYTTLETLVEISKHYLETKKVCANWVVKSEDSLPIRPIEEELDQATEIMMRYFEKLKILDSHKDLVDHPFKSSADYRTKGENENIFFRPIAQVALAAALGQLEKDYDLEKLMNILARQERMGSLKLREKNSIWYGVLCNPADENMRRNKGDQQLCTKLLIHLLGSKSEVEPQLLESFREARKHGNEYINLDGESVANKEEVNLPKPWI